LPRIFSTSLTDMPSLIGQVGFGCVLSTLLVLSSLS
jgi:hypothetical protein